MIFMVNDVIRSLSNTERVRELKMLLLGRTIHINEKDSLTVHDILLSNHKILFCDKVDTFEIDKVKKIEINVRLKCIKITNKTQLFIIPLP